MGDDGECGPAEDATDHARSDRERTRTDDRATGASGDDPAGDARLQHREAAPDAELERVFDRIDDAFFALDDAWRFTYLNERGREVIIEAMGRPGDVDDLVGRTIWDVLPEAVDTPFYARYHEAMATQEPVTFEDHYEPLDTWFEVRAYPDEGGLSVYFRDVTERVQREHELEQYETIVETINEGVYVVDDDGQFTWVNGAYAEMVGYDPADLVGAHVSKVVDRTVTEAAQTMEAELRAGERDDGAMEAELQTADGGTVPAAATFALLPGTDGERRRVGVVRDITERRQYEQTLRALYDSAHELFDAGSEDAVSETVVETVTEVLDIPGVAVYRHDDRDDELHPAASSIESDFMRSELPSVPPGEGSITGHVYATGEPRRLDDVTASPHMDPDAADTELRAGVFVPMGDHGVLIVGSRTVGAFDESVLQLLELLAANAAEAYDRVGRERELQRYEAIVETIWDGVYALDDEERFVLVNEAFCEMTGYDRSTLLGRHASFVHDETTSERAAELAADRADADEPAVMEVELPTADGGGVPVESRFGPYEAADGGRRRAGVVRDVTERIRRERELERQRARLAALDHLNTVVRRVTSALIDQSTRPEIEATLCEALAASTSYEFAWVGEVDAATETVALRTEAGVDGYLEDATVPVDVEDGAPAARAVRTGEMHVVEDVHAGSGDAAWRERAADHGTRSVAAIPIHHGGSLYGVLSVHADRQDAFQGEERAVVGQLGEVVGHAIAAVERKRALTSDELLEVDLQVPDLLADLDVEGPVDDPVTFDRAVPLEGGEFLLYGTAQEAWMATLETMVASFDHWERVRVVDDAGDRRSFELLLTEPPVLTALARHGGHLKTARLVDGRFEMTVEAPPSVGVRQLLEVVRETYPDAEMRARRQVTRDDERSNPVATAFESELTDRQRSVLEAAYFAGYFEWPRKSSGEDLAQSLDIAPATFSQHLRRAQNHLVGALVEEPSPV